MGNPLLPQAVNKVHDRKLRHVAIFRPEWWKEGDFFFPRRERESNLSLWHDDVGLGQFFTYLNGLSHLVIFMYLFVALFIFIREISFNLNSEYRQLMHFSWIACLHPPPPPPPFPSLATPVATFYGSPWYLTMYVDLQGRFLGCLLFYPFTEILISQSTNLSYDCSSNEAYLSTCFNFK